MLEFGSQSSHPSDVLKKTAASDASHGSGGGANGGGGGADGGGADGGGGGGGAGGRGDGGSGDGATPLTAVRVYAPMVSVRSLASSHCCCKYSTEPAAVGSDPIPSASMMRTATWTEPRT